MGDARGLKPGLGVPPDASATKAPGPGPTVGLPTDEGLSVKGPFYTFYSKEDLAGPQFVMHLHGPYSFSGNMVKNANENALWAVEKDKINRSTGYSPPHSPSPRLAAPVTCGAVARGAGRLAVAATLSRASRDAIPTSLAVATACVSARPSPSRGTASGQAVSSGQPVTPAGPAVLSTVCARPAQGQGPVSCIEKLSRSTVTQWALQRSRTGGAGLQL
eukprot:gene8411-206_t